jgi:hypothetical protein
MVQQEKVEDEPKPDEPPPDEPPAISTGLTGADGLAGLGVAKPGQGNGTGKIGGSGRRGGKYDVFAGQLQSTIASAMKQHSKTKTAAFSVQARIWADASGRIVRVSLAGSTGDASIDEALKNDVLNGLQLKEAPPADMPMPIVMRLNAKKQSGLAQAR